MGTNSLQPFNLVKPLSAIDSFCNLHYVLGEECTKNQMTEVLLGVKTVVRLNSHIDVIFYIGEGVVMW